MKRKYNQKSSSVKQPVKSKSTTVLNPSSSKNTITMSTETFDTLSSNDTPAISNLNNFTTNTHSILDKLDFSKKLNKHNLSRSMQFSNIISSRNKFNKHRSHSTHHSVSFSTTASCLNVTSLLKEIDSLSKKASSLYNQLNQKNKKINELTISNKQKENQHLIEIIKNDMSYIDNQYHMEIELLKQKILKKEKTMISKEIHFNKINEEMMKFKNKKLILLDQLIEYRKVIGMLTQQQKSQNCRSSNYKYDGSINASAFNTESFLTDTQQGENYISNQCSPKRINGVMLFTSKFIVNK